MVRIRRDVATLAGDDKTLYWYGVAISRLRERALNDPTGWRYIAAVHGAPEWPDGDPYYVEGEEQPSGEDRQRFWDQCQHQTWFFLSWHRGYLAAFEAIVAKVVEEEGGPDNWALPYWNYSADATSKLMPQPFCSDDGGANPLWVQWGRTDDGDMGFSDEDVSIDCLGSKFFAGTGSGGEVGFAGPISDFVHFGGLVGLPNGRIEDLPHNSVHSQIGGLMGNPNYAALDPIFWLHHSNIDRLWEVWRVAHPDLANPQDPRWRSDVQFELHVTHGSVWTFKSEDLLDTKTVLHGYEFDDVSLPAGVSLGLSDMPEIAPDDASLAGASTQAVDIVDGIGEGTLTVGGDEMSLSVATPRVYLNLENIVGKGEDANFRVFARDLDGGEPVMVGQVSMFGLEAASSRDSPHGGGGLNKVIEITPFADQLNLTAPGDTELEVRFERRARRTDRPGFLEREGGARVRVGRVSVYYAPGDPE